MNKEKLLGRKVRGFKFKSTEHLPYDPLMDKYIGKIGTIEKLWLIDESCKVTYKDDYWVYPLMGIEKHLIDENNQIK